MPIEPRYLERGQARAVELWPGVMRRTLVHGERMLLCEIELPRGSVVEPHHHVHEQIGYVARGRLEFTVDGKTFVVERGGGYLVPSNAVHQVLALEDSIAVDVFSPVRDEYIDR
jgi:quercetin dioxygenase-like cupin family protein